MTVQLATGQVWQEIESNIFAVLGMVSSRGEARTVGVIYFVDKQNLYICTDKEAWKTKHVARNPNVSLTIPIAKRIPFMPWIKIPAATITFSGVANVLQYNEARTELLKKIYGQGSDDETQTAELCFIEVIPQGEFLTYGIGVSLLQMRDHEKARGRAAV